MSQDSTGSTPQPDPVVDDYMRPPGASTKAPDDNYSPYEKVFARLKELDCLSGEGVRISDGGGDSLVRCPAHDDRKASLSIREVDDGKVLVKCFADCTTEAVVAALGLRMADLFPGPTIYSYTDLAGNVCHQTVRYEPKAFKQRRPDGNGPRASASQGHEGISGIASGAWCAQRVVTSEW